MHSRSFLPHRSKTLHSRPVSSSVLALMAVLLLSLCPAVAQTAKPKPSARQHTPPDLLQQHYDAARTFAVGGDQAHASVEYKTFLAEALRRMANARTNQGSFAAADALFKDALAVAPE